MTIHSKKVLVVEDSRAINELLTYTLRHQYEIEVESATSLEETRQILEDRKDDFFLATLDLNLPDAPNGEVVDYVLSMGIPPIVLTGSLCDETHNMMFSKPILDYVVKRNMNEIQYVTESIARLRNNIDRKVLIVDDSASSRQHLTSLLELHFLNVITASDGVEGLAQLEKHPDTILVITDYNMPNMDGMELISRIREKHSRHELAVLGISSQDSGSLSAKLLKSGANDFIRRPFIHEELYCRINHSIDAVESYLQLQSAATRDFLTGLFNRKYVFESGYKLFRNAQRSNVTLATAILDIDYFKKINDTYGHHIGDLALKHISDILTHEFRDTDIVARMGGEEFCVLCLNLDAANAEKLLERVRDAIERSPLVVDDITVPITTSIGYCMELPASIEEMINHADTALYQAKESGRNRVIRYAPDISELNC